MQSKTIFHEIPAGSLPQDAAVEIFGDRKTKEVFFMTKGRTYDFEHLPEKHKRQLLKKMLADKKAMQQLGHLGYKEALKRFAFCLYGSLDHIPDYCKNGNLGITDNFRCSDNCQCLKWETKSISTSDGQNISNRQLQIIDLIKQGFPDKAIAHQLGIALATLNNHKSAIMKKLKAYSKVDIITSSINQNILN